MERKRSVEQFDGFVRKSLEVFENLDENGGIFDRGAKSSPESVKFGSEPLGKDRNEYWSFPSQKGRQICQAEMKIDAWMKSLNACDRKIEFFELGREENEQKQNILIRHDFGKEIRSQMTFAGGIQSERGVSPKREVLMNIPLSPETQKKNELCSYLQLMNMNNADKKTVNAIQNRRSNRVKNLKIMSEKRNLEQKLLAEFKESLEKKSFEELGMVVKENYQITNVTEKINFNIELIPESLLREVENFDDSIMKVIGSDIKKKIRDDRKSIFKENKKKIRKCKKDFDSISLDPPKLMFNRNNYHTKSLRSSINLNEVGIKALTLQERKFKSLRSVVNLNNVGIKSLTLNERKIKQMANRKKVEMQKSFLSKKLRLRENAKRINVKIKMNNERINNKPRISHKNGNVRRSMDKAVTRKQKVDIEKMRKSKKNIERREKIIENRKLLDKIVKNQDGEILKNADNKVIKDEDDGMIKRQEEKLVKIQDIKITNVEDGKIIVRRQCGTTLNSQENRGEVPENDFRETRNNKYVITHEESDEEDVKEEPKVIEEGIKKIDKGNNKNGPEVNIFNPSKVQKYYDNSTCHKMIRQPNNTPQVFEQTKKLNGSKTLEKGNSKTMVLLQGSEKVVICNDVNINNDYKTLTTKKVPQENYKASHLEKKPDMQESFDILQKCTGNSETQKKTYSPNRRSLLQVSPKMSTKNTETILFDTKSNDIEGSLGRCEVVSPRTLRSELSPRSQRLRLASGLSSKLPEAVSLGKTDLSKLEIIEKQNVKTIKNNNVGNVEIKRGGKETKATESNGEIIDNKNHKKIKLNLGTAPLKKRRISLLSTGRRSTENDPGEINEKLPDETSDNVYSRDLAIKTYSNRNKDRKDNLLNGKKTPDVPTTVSPDSTVSLSTAISDNNSLSPTSKNMAEIRKCVFREDKTEMLNKLQASFNVVDLSQSSSCVNNSLHLNYAYDCWKEHNYTKRPELEVNKYNKELLMSDSDEREFSKESYKEIPRINPVPPNDIFEPKKMQVKPTRNLRKLLTQKNRNNSDTLETLSNENCFDEQVSTNSIKIDRTKGKILNAHYQGFNLVIIQEQLISFWTQSPLGNMLGVHNLWVSKGQVQRLPLDSNYICKDSQEVIVNFENKSCAYIELWMKEHKSEKRELPLADVFATVYFWTSKNVAVLNKKLLQLANIKGNIKDVQYVVLRTARKIVVSWVETQNTLLTTIVSCYVLSPDYQTVVNILELTSVNHYVRSLHTMGDCCDVVVGFGENHITIWELEYGEIFETIEISQRYRDPKMLWLERDRGLLFFIQYHKLERLLMLVAVNGYSKESKKMQVFRIPAGYSMLKGLCVDNNMLSAVFKNGVLCWNIRTGDEIVAELSSQPHLIPSSKHLIAIKSNTVEVTHFQSYFLANFDLQL